MWGVLTDSLTHLPYGSNLSTSSTDYFQQPIDCITVTTSNSPADLVTHESRTRAFQIFFIPDSGTYNSNENPCSIRAPGTTTALLW